MTMKRGAAALLAAFCMISGAQALGETAPETNDIAWVSAMLAPDPSEQPQGVAVSGDSHLRTGPGLSYESVDVARADATLTYDGATEVDERGVEWYRVKVGEQSLWISSKYSALTAAPVATAAPEATRAPEAPEATTAPASSQIVTVTEGSVNVRKGPGLNYDSLVALSEGESAAYAGRTQADERGVDWYAVVWQGADEAWVSSKYTVLK